MHRFYYLMFAFSNHTNFSYFHECVNLSFSFLFGASFCEHILHIYYYMDTYYSSSSRKLYVEPSDQIRITTSINFVKYLQSVANSNHFCIQRASVLVNATYLALLCDESAKLRALRTLAPTRFTHH